MINLIQVLVVILKLLIILQASIKTKIKDKIKTIHPPCLAKVCLVDKQITLMQEHKMLVSTSRLHNLLKNTDILKIKIGNSDQTWKTLAVMLINVLGIKHVDYSEYLMVMVENRYLNIVQKHFQLNLGKKYKRNHKIYTRFMNKFSKKLIVSW